MRRTIAIVVTVPKILPLRYAVGRRPKSNRGAENDRATICPGLDYKPICASMGGHLSFHGAAAS